MKRSQVRLSALVGVLGALALACQLLPGAGTIPPSSAAGRLGALDDAGEVIAAALDRPGGADLEAILRHFRQDRAFQASGVAPDGSIWARFAGGPIVVVPPEAPAPADASSGSGPGLAAPPASGGWESLLPRRASGENAWSAPLLTRSADSDLPSSDVAVMMDALGGTFGQFGSDIDRWLDENGYDSRVVEPTVDNLKAVDGVGVFYFGTHGGLGVGLREDPFADWTYSLWTATPATGANDAKYEDDLEAGRLVYMLARFIPKSQGGKPEWRYAITIQFIRQYMSFAENSLVFLDACGSFDHDMKFGFADAGASLFLGWTEPVAPGDRSRYFFDRLLGVNEIQPKDVPHPEPPNRPFDYEAILGAMQRYGLDRYRSTREVLDEGVGGEFEKQTVAYEAVLRAERMGGSFSVLLPTIRNLEVAEEEEKLRLMGLFGDEAGEVEIGGAAAEVLSWSSEEVSVRLPAADTAGGSGDVVVRVRDHESNAVPLTLWHGEVRHTEFLGAESPVLKGMITFDLYFRADVHPHRDTPDEKPIEPRIDFFSAPGSGAKYECSGREDYEGGVEAGNSTATYSGAGEIPMLLPGEEGTPGFYITGMVDTVGDKVDGVDEVVHVAGDECTLTITQPDYPTVEKRIFSGISEVFGLGPTLNGLVLLEGYAVRADTRESLPVGIEPGAFWWKAVDSWDEIPAEPAPDEETPG